MSDQNHTAVPSRLLVAVWAVLMGMLALTYGLAHIDLGPLNLVVALGIGFVKAGLVLWFFMELRDSSPLVKAFSATGFFWFALLLALGLADFLSRGWLYRR